MKANEQARALRKVASELEAAAERMPSSEKVIRDFGKPSLNVENSVDATLLGRTDFDLRRYMAKQTAHQLADYIAPSIGTELDASLRTGAIYSTYPYGSARYRATVYVFTERELNQLVSKAMLAAKGVL